MADEDPDPLLDLLAELVAIALDADAVTIDLLAYGHEDAPMGGTFRREAAQSTTCTSVMTSGSKLVIERSGGPRDVAQAERLVRWLASAASRIAPPPGRIGLREELRLVRERRALEALERDGWRVSAAARWLQLPRSHVYRMMRGLRERRRTKARRRA